nr:hypothetical protein CFP56_76575 [Quercus suber]
MDPKGVRSCLSRPRLFPPLVRGRCSERYQNSSRRFAHAGGLGGCFQSQSAKRSRPSIGVNRWGHVDSEQHPRRLRTASYSRDFQTVGVRIPLILLSSTRLVHQGGAFSSP